MPSSSKAQEDFMRAVAHSRNFARKAGVSQSVGKDFNDADKAAGAASEKKMRHERVYKDKK